MSGIRLSAAVLVLLAGTLGPAAAAPAKKASLRIASVAPLVVKGSGFPKGKPVRVIAVSSTRAVQRARADRFGRFQATFSDIDVEVGRCSGGLSVSARGANGVYALAKIAQSPDCAPGLGP